MGGKGGGIFNSAKKKISPYICPVGNPFFSLDFRAAPTSRILSEKWVTNEKQSRQSFEREHQGRGITYLFTNKASNEIHEGYTDTLEESKSSK